MTSSHDLLRNALLDANDYKFVKQLGKGSYAKVYLVKFNNVSYRVVTMENIACKVIDITKAPYDYRKKFLPRELDILRKINHPHIIRTLAIYKAPEEYLIFMRYAEKGDLLDLIDRIGAVNENQARMWVKQIALAIEYLHELEIAHRDIKCENILVTANYNAKLADFGFSKFLLNKRGLRVLSETYCGSPSYCAPEILKGQPYNPKVADLWSLGVVIFVMLNKALPFEGLNVKKLYEQQIAKRWKFRPHIEQEVSWEVKELLHNLLEPSWERRYIISEVLHSAWLFMDHRLIGMTEDESLALLKAKEQRKQIEEKLLSPIMEGRDLKQNHKNLEKRWRI